MRKALYILSDLDDQDLQWLVGSGSYQKHRAGSTLIRAGEPVTHFYIVVTGELHVILPPAKKIGDMGTGDIIGEMSLIEKRPPDVNIIVTVDAKLLAIPHEVLRARLKSDTAFAAHFYHALVLLLSDRLRTRVAEAATDSDIDLQLKLERENELDENVLDSLHVAGDRMRRLIHMLDEGAQ